MPAAADGSSPVGGIGSEMGDWVWKGLGARLRDLREFRSWISYGFPHLGRRLVADLSSEIIVQSRVVTFSYLYCLIISFMYDEAPNVNLSFLNMYYAHRRGFHTKLSTA